MARLAFVILWIFPSIACKGRWVFPPLHSNWRRARVISFHIRKFIFCPSLSIWKVDWVARISLFSSIILFFSPAPCKWFGFAILAISRWLAFLFQVFTYFFFCPHLISEVALPIHVKSHWLAFLFKVFAYFLLPAPHNRVGSVFVVISHLACFVYFFFKDKIYHKPRFCPVSSPPTGSTDLGWGERAKICVG